MDNGTLFSSFKLRDTTLKNRIGVAPMTRMSSNALSIPRTDVFDFLITRARNGAAMVYTEAIVTDYESAQGYPGQSRMLTQPQLDAWAPVTGKIRGEGSVAIMQMFHCGRMSWPEVNPAGRVIAPSALAPAQLNPMTGETYPLPDVMSSFDMEHVKSGFVETAKGAAAAGFDGVEIHAAHGYLLSQFLSSYSNERTDEYGGSIEGRYRYLHEVITAVKNALPADLLLIVRISNWGIADSEVSLFGSKDEYQRLVRLLDSEPIDALSVSTYNFSDAAFGTRDTMARITREVTGKPLIICGGIYDRLTADEALKDADVILSGKSMLLNPDWIEDIKAGKALKRYRAEDADIAYTDTALP